VSLSAFGTLAQFEPSCVSDKDYGWPRFQNRSHLEADQAWATYFQVAYGELPQAYPVCVFDLWFLNPGAYIAAGLNGTRPLVDASKVVEGDLYIALSLFGIYHSTWAPLPSNTWFEVTHSVLPTEMVGAWVWRTHGSGIWGNTGRTLVFPSPSDPSQTHAEAIAFLKENCSVAISPKWPQLESDIFGLCAREKGIDSIQFEPQDGQVPLGTFNLTGLTEAVLVSVDGDKSCGVPEPSATPLRAGWQASRTCGCVNDPIPPACGLMPKPPPPMIREKPPLCELRAEDRSASCDPNACKPWSCE